MFDLRPRLRVNRVERVDRELGEDRGADPEQGSPPSLSAEESPAPGHLAPLGAPKKIPFTVEPA